MSVLGWDVPSLWFAVVLVLVALSWYLAASASRLDRLHHRVDGARGALENQLLRRATAAGELAASGLLDPATSLLLAGAAAEAVAAGEEAGDRRVVAPTLPWPGPESEAEREMAESNLSRSLRAALDDPALVAALRSDPLGASLVSSLDASCHRVELARRFHNDAVSQARRVRGKWVARWARLAGRAGPLSTFEMDDAPPAAIRG
ncbi:MAG TPA: hypothetical protein VFD41_07410 [Actinomycetales bacterium]|nr:hypothetical protein [Actinomycetales bacterium]